MQAVSNRDQSKDDQHLIQPPPRHHQAFGKAHGICEQTLKLLIECHLGEGFIFHIHVLHRHSPTRNIPASAHPLARLSLALYLTLMTWLLNIGLFDICDRARLGERFFGATHTVLARL